MASLAPVLFCCGALRAEAPASLGISFSSEPAGATVCKKILQREECFGTTPLTVPLVQEDASSSSKFVLKKLGHRTHERYVEQKAQRISVRLDKRDLLFDPDQHNNPKIRELQRASNERLSRLLYSNGIRGEPRFELVGHRTVHRIDDRLVLAFPILVNSYETLRNLKQAGRQRDDAKRHADTLAVFEDAGIFALFDEVLKTLAALPLDRIAFNVLYAKSTAVLEFEQVEHLNQRYTGSHYTGTGTTRQRVDTYEVYTTRQDVTVVKDREVSVDYSFIVSVSHAKSGGGRFFAPGNGVEIVTNDTPNGRYLKIGAP